MFQPDYLISTPENVDLHLELAGIGNRVLACLIDTLVSYLMVASISLALAFVFAQSHNLLPSAPARVMLEGIFILFGLLLSFAVLFGYYIFFECIWQGQTPGKRLVHIRVIEQNGQPVSFSSVWIRNLMRVMDTGLILIGLLAMAVDKSERRFGDLAAGTLVVRERLPELVPANLTVKTSTEANESFDIGRISPPEYELLLTFLNRRKSMSKLDRQRLAEQMADYFRQALQELAMQESPEAFLERVYQAYQSRAF